jgi:transposase
MMSVIMADQRVAVHPRTAWMIYYSQKKSVRKVCERFGISRKTFYKWWKRYEKSGYDPKSLEDESRKPHNSPRATPPEIIDQILAAKADTGFGQRRLRTYLADRHNIVLSEHTIWKLLKRHYGEGSSQIGHAAGNRVTKESPGQVVQISVMDISPYANRPAFQYTAVDAATRLRISKIYEKHSSRSATEFLEFLSEKFPFPMAEIHTPDDRVFTNGSPTMGLASALFLPFRLMLRNNNIRHLIRHSGEPKTTLSQELENVDEREFYSKRKTRDIEVLSKELAEFVGFYNNHRKTDGARELTPLQRLKTFEGYSHVAYFDPS